MTSIPNVSLDPSGPFTAAQAAAAGIPRGSLRSRRFRRVLRGVYVRADVTLTAHLRLRAALLAVPPDALVSHTSAARLHGFDPARSGPMEFSTNGTGITERAGVLLHRRRGRLTPYVVDGLPCTGPDRTFVDCATRLNIVQLVQLGDHLLHSGATTLAVLLAYCHARHLDGVQRARRAASLVRAGVESPRETLVRLLLVFARLPCPLTNTWIVDDNGRRVARVDMLYARYKVIVEYDGWQHERNATQRQRDRERREALEALGYRLIIVTDADLKTPASIPWRVYDALAARGYRGPKPATSVMWQRWFAAA